MRRDNLLLRAFADPPRAAALRVEEWELLLSQARHAKLTARLASRLEQISPSLIPARVRQQFAAARLVADGRRQVLEWEVNRLRRELAAAQVPYILLKGAAYAHADLPLARGRVSVDVDIMVPRKSLDIVERHLLDHGWEPTISDRYDQRYYRTWMHELPALQHRDRGTNLDLHHTIVPISSRLHPDPAALWQSAVSLAGTAEKILGPTDMALHTAVHLFFDGEIAGGIGDLLDFDELCRHFGQQSGYWGQLVPRAISLGLQRPLFYALRYSALLLATPVPAAVQQAAQQPGPNRLVLKLMDGLVGRVLIPDLRYDAPRWWGLARFCLLLRSHWLRMPPLLLASHLLRKLWRQACTHAGIRQRSRDARAA